jgi:hypothetical protein
MKYAIQVVITTDEGQTETRDIACLEREDLTPTTLGLTLAEGKAILKALQEIVVEQQMTAYLEMQRPCAQCGHVQRRVSRIPPRRSVPWPPCSLSISHRSCCFWKRSGQRSCRMASPPSSYRRCCRSMTRSPRAPFASTSSPSRNGWSSGWGSNCLNCQELGA